MNIILKKFFERWAANILYKEAITNKWHIKWMDGVPCEGECDTTQRILYIGTLGTFKQTQKIILHEIAHAILYEIFYNNIKDQKDLFTYCGHTKKWKELFILLKEKYFKKIQKKIKMYNISNYNFTKGDIGEEIGRRFLEKKGYMLYAPMKKEAHPFDRIAIKWDMKPMALDFKAYPSRLYYPDTGINYNHYLKYKEYPHDFYIFFIDEIRKKMYGNKFSELLKPITTANNIYPLIQKGKKGKKIYFPLNNMELYATLSPQTCKKLEKVSNSKHYITNKTPKKFNIKWKKNKSWIK